MQMQQAKGEYRLSGELPKDLGTTHKFYYKVGNEEAQMWSSLLRGFLEGFPSL